MERLLAFIALLAFIFWILRPQIRQWQNRRRLRDFEQEQRRKWEQHRRE
jgi:hypothetical protein